jgi:hypothetical protein
MLLVIQAIQFAVLLDDGDVGKYVLRRAASKGACRPGHQLSDNLIPPGNLLGAAAEA